MAVVSLCISNLVIIALAAASAEAKPTWADQGDVVENSGHRLICEGSGASEELATTTAIANCNDKVCRICGVEVEATVETKETLKGIDVQRRIFERCRRVRKHELLPRYKSVDCGPSGCTAWLYVDYSNDTLKEECPRYTQENFADPQECERDIENFKTESGRDAAAFRRRVQFLDAALTHCSNIDVRPTPALMALVEKLIAGQNAFEFTERAQTQRLRDDQGSFFGGNFYKNHDDMMRFRSKQDYYLTEYPPFRQQFAETKLLVDRIRMLRDLCFHKAQLFDVVELLLEQNLDSSVGLQRLLTAMEKLPTVPPYGEPNLHFSTLFSLGRLKSDTTAIGAFMRRAYPAEKADSGMAWELAKFFADDKKVSADEWDYVFRVHQKSPCVHCLRVLLAAGQHIDASGAHGNIRDQRFFTALASVPEIATHEAKRRILLELVPTNEPIYALELAKKLPANYREAFDIKLIDEVISRLDYPPIDPMAADLFNVSIEKIRGTYRQPLSEDQCRDLDRRFEVWNKYRINFSSLNNLFCDCLMTSLNSVPLYDSAKGDLYRYAVSHNLPCVN